MQNNRKSVLIWTCILIAWIFDLLFWKHQPGISYLIMVALVLTGGFMVAAVNKIRPAMATLLLVPVILFFALMTVFRSEPMTIFVCVAASVFLLALAAVTFTGGKWWNYSFSDFIAKYFGLFLSMLSRFIIFSVQKPAVEAGETPAEPVKKPAIHWSVVRGLIIALPIVLVLAALLGSADPVFNMQLENLLKIFKIEKLGEYLFRLFYILVLAYLLAGTLLHAYTQSSDEHLIGKEKPWMVSFLGWVESVIILGGIDLLFAAFVFIQFKYFFGGTGNINVAGYTFAEYARKGFNEMVIVAILSLFILQVLSTITKRDQPRQGIIFSGLGLGLVALVIVILISAFQRLQLYEIAYGFSRIRLYSHIFMIWLGILLVATLVIEVLGRQRAFAMAVLVSALGFCATLALINVDQFIARENIQRKASQHELDVPYLVSLSDDAIPYLAQAYQSPSSDASLKIETGVVLSCKLKAISQSDLDDDGNPRPAFWGSYQWSRENATAILNGLKADLDTNYPVLYDQDQYSDYVNTAEGRIYCNSTSSMDD
jgi:hypothetical protein